VRRIAAASQQGIKGLTAVNARVAFLTHLHSDHTIGYADLILTPWSVGRSQPLEVYGPAGLKHMTDHILEAYPEDIAIRRRDKQVLGVPEQAEGYKVHAHEIAPGTVYKDHSHDGGPDGVEGDRAAIESTLTTCSCLQARDSAHTRSRR
jgi:ribonuclease BN (tRNA processing enzyme)